MRSFGHLTVTALLCTSWLCAGCFFSGGSTSDSLELPDVRAVQLRTISSSPHLYEVEDDQGGLGTFVTAIRDCSLNPKTSRKSATRQLLVGMKEIRISDQRTIPLEGGEVLYSKVSSIADGQPIDLSLYSAQRGNCFVDIAVWRSAEQAPDLTRPFDELAVVTELLSGALPS